MPNSRPRTERATNKQTNSEEREEENPAHSAKPAHCLAQQGAVFKTAGVWVGEGGGVVIVENDDFLFFSFFSAGVMERKSRGWNLFKARL